MTFKEIYAAKYIEAMEWVNSPDFKHWENPRKPLLTVRDFIDELKTYDPDAVLAIWHNSRPGITMMRVGDAEAGYYMKKKPRNQPTIEIASTVAKLPSKQRENMRQVVLLTTSICNDEIADGKKRKTVQ